MHDPVITNTRSSRRPVRRRAIAIAALVFPALLAVLPLVPVRGDDDEAAQSDPTTTADLYAARHIGQAKTAVDAGERFGALHAVEQAADSLRQRVLEMLTDRLPAPPETWRAEPLARDRAVIREQRDDAATLALTLRYSVDTAGSDSDDGDEDEGIGAEVLITVRAWQRRPAGAPGHIESLLEQVGRDADSTRAVTLGVDEWAFGHRSYGIPGDPGVTFYRAAQGRLDVDIVAVVAGASADALETWLGSLELAALAGWLPPTLSREGYFE